MGRPPLLMRVLYLSREKATIMLCPMGKKTFWESGLLVTADATSLDPTTFLSRRESMLLLLSSSKDKEEEDDEELLLLSSIVVTRLELNRGRDTLYGISFRMSTKTFFQPSESSARDICTKSSVFS